MHGGERSPFMGGVRHKVPIYGSGVELCNGPQKI